MTVLFRVEIKHSYLFAVDIFDVLIDDGFEAILSANFLNYADAKDVAIQMLDAISGKHPETYSPLPLVGLPELFDKIVNEIEER